MSTTSRDHHQITGLLLAWRGGDDVALARLMPLVYRQLKDIAGHLLRQLDGHDTLHATALVNEAYLRIVDLDRISWQDRAHFFAMCARLMRRILIDHARYLTRDKRGGGISKISIDENLELPGGRAPELLRLDEALQELAQHDAQLSQLIELRFFAGLDRREAAEVLGISNATATRRWRSARAWLIHYLSEADA